MATFYLSGSWNRRQELQGYRDQLETFGHTNVSSWLDPGPYDELDGELTIEMMADIAQTDLYDIDKAEFFIAFTEPEGSTNTRGGRHVEWGYALGRPTTTLVIGPVENCFYAIHKTFRFDTWEQFVEETTS